jgi:hypothetical protein
MWVRMVVDEFSSFFHHFGHGLMKGVLVFFRMINQIDPTCKAKKKAKERAEGLLRR